MKPLKKSLNDPNFCKVLDQIMNLTVCATETLLMSFSCLFSSSQNFVAVKCFLMS